MSGVRVRFWGTGDALGSGGRLQTCIQVQAPDRNFLIDCGASSLSAMKRFGGDPSAIDLILVSHLHGDHFGGIPFFILEYQFNRRTSPLVIVGPPGVEDRVKQAMEVFLPGSTAVQRKFATQFIELKGGEPARLGTLAVTPYEVVHFSGAPSFALRMEIGGKVISYSGDTEWTENLVPAARGADLFICEGYSFEKKIKYHLDYQTLIQNRSRLACQRMILVHMNKEMLAHLQEAEVEGAEDGREIEV